MNLSDFTGEGIVPGIAYGFKCDLTPVRAWIARGLIECPNEQRPDPLQSVWKLTAKGAMEIDGIDRTRHPYTCGRVARKNNKSRDSHGLCEGPFGTLECWLAGWDEGGK